MCSPIAATLIRFDMGHDEKTPPIAPVGQVQLVRAPAPGELLL